MTVTFEFFSEARIALQREIGEHDRLVHLIAEAGFTVGEDWPSIVAMCAAYLGIEMDGVYTPKEMEYLEDKYYWKLRRLRTMIILPANAGSIN